MSEAPTVLIMAAGQGTRMRSERPKVLHEVCGRPMVAWPALAAREAGAGRIVAIVSPDRDLSSGLPEGVETTVQPEADGTGGAVRAALEIVKQSSSVIVLSGDHPLISSEQISAQLATHRESGAAATLMSLELDDPGAYGRVVRDAEGEIERIVEAKAVGDASPEQLAIKEINAGTYVFEAAPLAKAIDRLTNDNAQGEYYLGDVMSLIREAGGRIAAYRSDDPAITLGVNDRADLAVVSEEARRRILHARMLAGVTIVDPASTWIDVDVEIAADVTIEPGCMLRGATAISSGSVIGPMTTLIGTRLGEGVHVPHSYLVDCEASDRAVIGPFAYIRPQTEVGDGAKVGAFVELKNAQLGEGAKVPHLSYVGDTEIGPGSNLGAGTITANYDGFRKHRTVIGADVRTGVDTALVAPVHIGDGAYTGAGSVITKDVPEGALGIAREKQRNIEGYADRKAGEQKTKEDDDS